MNITNKKEPAILFAGDIFFFLMSLWITLLIRYFDVPSYKLLINHIIPFSNLFLIWFIVFFIAGLYEKHTLIFRNKLPSTIFNAQIINSIIAVSFFYFFPYSDIAPKTVLFIYLAVSLILIYLWRVKIFPFVSKRKKESAILIGSGEEMQQILNETNKNEHSELNFVSFIDLNEIDEIDFQSEVIERIYSENIRSIVVDLKNKKIEVILPHLYNLIFSNVRFIDMDKLYESTFDRIPLSLIGYNWFLENISSSTHLAYDFLKRAMDVIVSIILGSISLIVYPFVIIAIKLDDKGPIFIIQERFGQGNRIIKMIKFRSMKVSDSGVWPTENDTRITKVGSFLRKTRIDELPQLWNVLVGDISLIGPRPDIIDLGKQLTQEIPYYTIRNLVKPGLSGWAQIKQDKPPHSVEETKMRLAYDLYYIKNRSLFLDLKIALKTIKTLTSRTGK